MKTEYRYIEFIQHEQYWTCKNHKHGETLGAVSWYPEWKTYVFAPELGCEFSSDCLRDIADFMEQLNKERK